MALTPEHRRQIARQCRDRSCRSVGNREDGVRWEPLTTVNPETGFPYSDGSAWNLIADSLEDPRTEIRDVVLDRPPGATGHEWLIRRPGYSSLYVKIQPSKTGRLVLGRSFHLALYEDFR